MHDSTDIQSSIDRRDAPQLLEEFLSGQDREAAFGALVDSYGGLVYSSALRRTNDAQLAEEVAQNVFAILARKAASLRRHPALMAWIFKTTRYESSKAMRAERRRQQKHDALARESHEPSPPPNDDRIAWLEAVPLLDASLDDLNENDRQIVLQRFFEERKFKEIAQESGRSEAACRMQLKRALKKLSKLLSKRGVALSATVIASGLAAELTHAAPAKTLAAIAPKALAASGQLGTAAVAVSSLQIMSTIKTVTATGAAVIAVASAPFLWQQSNAKNLDGDLAELKSQRLALAGRVEDWRSSGGGAGFKLSASAAPGRTVQDLLETSDGPIDVDVFLKSITEVMMTEDIVGMIRVLLPISKLSQGEYDDLVAAIGAHSVHAEVKEVALQMMGSFAPSDNPQETIERLLKMGVTANSYTDLLSQWGSSDPAAALAWYLDKEAEGAFVSKGVSNQYEGRALADLLGGIAAVDPTLALEVFKENRNKDSLELTISNLGSSFGSLIKKEGDDGPLRELLALMAAPEKGIERAKIVMAAIQSAVPPGEFEKQFAFAMKYLDDPVERMQTAVNAISYSGNIPVADRADWLLENAPADLQAKAIGDMMRLVAIHDENGASDWTRKQSGPVRDSGLHALSDYHALRGQYQLAFEHATQIEKAETKTIALAMVAQGWVQSDRDAASKVLPAELVEEFQPAAPESTSAEILIRDITIPE